MDDKSITKQYRSIVSFIFLLMLIYGVVRSLLKFTSARILNEDISLSAFMFICEIANAVFLFAIMRKKKWGLIAFFIMLLAQIPINIIVGCEDMTSIVASTFVRIIIISLILLVKNDGYSGWNILFNSNSDNVDIASDVLESVAQNNSESKSTDSAEIETLINECSTNKTPDGILVSKGNDSEQERDIQKCNVSPQERENHNTVIPSDEIKGKKTLAVENLKVDNTFKTHIGKNKSIFTDRKNILKGAFYIALLIIGIIIAYNGCQSSHNNKNGVYLEFEKNLRLDGNSDLDCNFKNASKVYSVLKKSKYSGMGKNLDEFFTFIQKPDNRLTIFINLRNDGKITKEMSYDMFSSLIYPPTLYQQVLETDRNSLFKEIHHSLSYLSYDDFVDNLYDDDKLYDYYKRLESAFDLGSFEEFKDYIR